MLDSLRKIWNTVELRKKIIYTFLMLLLYRLVGVIPAPGIDPSRLTGQMDLPLLQLVNMMTGNAFSQMTIMAMGITPYINASIIMQLLCIAIPALERLQQDETGAGREKISRITRYVTVGLAALQAIGLAAGLSYIKSGWFNYVLVGVSMAGGAALAMWIGERITDKGIGNGISLLIFVGIVSNLFNGIISGFTSASAAGTTSGWVNMLVIFVVAILMTVVVTFVELAERRIPLQIAKQTKGRRVYGGQNTRMTLKVVSVGVMPLIFAYSFLSFPSTIIQMVNPNPEVGSFAYWWNVNMGNGAPLYVFIAALLIIGFTYFYSSISFDPKQQAEQLRMQGATIPGQRGKNIAGYLQNVVNRLNLFAALYLAILSAVPSLLTRSLNASVPFAASSILIAVSVALETVRTIQGEMSIRGIDMDVEKGGFM
jgi:preprotein translocase subunit SecY